MSLEQEIAANTAAINDLIAKLSQMSEVNRYRQQKAIEDEPPINEPIAVTEAPAPSAEELTQQLIDRVKEVHKKASKESITYFERVLEEFDVTSAKDLSVEALPNALRRYNELVKDLV